MGYSLRELHRFLFDALLDVVSDFAASELHDDVGMVKIPRRFWPERL